MFTGYPAIDAVGIVIVPSVGHLLRLSPAGERLWQLGAGSGNPVDPDNPPDTHSGSVHGAILVAEGPTTYAIGP